MLSYTLPDRRVPKRRMPSPKEEFNIPKNPAKWREPKNSRMRVGNVPKTPEMVVSSPVHTQRKRYIHACT